MALDMRWRGDPEAIEQGSVKEGFSRPDPATQIGPLGEDLIDSDQALRGRERTAQCGQCLPRAGLVVGWGWAAVLVARVIEHHERGHDATAGRRP